MAELTIQQTFDLALQHHQAGQLREAEQLYRQILMQQPNHPDALHLLGVLAGQVGQMDLGIELIRRAIAINPRAADYHNNLGNFLGDQKRIDEALEEYRQALRLKPDYLQAGCNLGAALRDSGQIDQAITVFLQVLGYKPDCAEAYCKLGLALRDKRQIDQAIAAIRQAIQLQPDFADAHGSLGIALRDKGLVDEAIVAFRRALKLKPDSVETRNNLGVALRDIGELDEAIDAYRQAIKLQPDSAEIHDNLGVALRDKGQLDEAIAILHRALVLKPDSAATYSNLGNALRDKGHVDEAIAACRQALQLKPDYADAHNNLGVALRDKGQVDEAIAAYREALRLKPDYAEAHNNLGDALRYKGQLDEAVAAIRQALQFRPDYVPARINLGVVMQEKGHLDEAISAFRQAIRHKPDSAEAYNNLGNAYKDQGCLGEAIDSYKSAMTLRPDSADMHSNFIYALHYHPDYDAQAIGRENHIWAQRHTKMLQGQIRPLIDRDPNCRLRIGYVSSDFWAHASAYFLVPLLEKHDPHQVELFCYAEVFRPDEITRRLQRVTHWRNTVDLSDEQVANQIREDRIDILVDLKLHTAHNRLLVFARKPAPIQMSWLGYPGSTGLSAIDYRLSDPYLDAPVMDESVYSERTIRLPDSFWCYDPLDGREIPTNSLPAQEMGFITFGCLNNFCKVNDGVLSIWAQILRQVKGSRLLLLAQPGSHRQRTVDRLYQERIDPGRIDFIPRQSRRAYLELYHRIDLGLDSFPYNGHTTSLDSIWMGVPVITLAGRTAVSRGGVSVLSNLGMRELIAQTPEQYVRIAVELAKDLPRMAELRSSLRQKMKASPLMDTERFTRNMETVYRQMWREYCRSPR